jgi:amino acid transporter
MALQTTPWSRHSKGHLLRMVGVGFGIAVSIGGTVGSGILRTPGEVAAQLRSPWLILAVWVFGGVYAFCATLCVTELGTMLPREGGWYVYSREAFGEYAGFLVGCCDWMMQTVAVAYLAVAFNEFAAGLLPVLGPHGKLGLLHERARGGDSGLFIRRRQPTMNGSLTTTFCPSMASYSRDLISMS